MPVYEFYCRQCNTIYKFLSRRINTETVPDCPKCKDVQLEKKVSLFATTSGKKDDSMDDGMPRIDEAKMEKAMTMLAGEADKINEDDPRQAAQLMRKLSDATGMRMGGNMEEALNRLERGDDPEQIEREMGDMLGDEEPFSFEGKTRKTASKEKPAIDDQLYEM